MLCLQNRNRKTGQKGKDCLTFFAIQDLGSNPNITTLIENFRSIMPLAIYYSAPPGHEV
jgi:hypothetical protein